MEMGIYSYKALEHKSQSTAGNISQKSSDCYSTFQFLDNRPEAIAQRKLQNMANASQKSNQITQLWHGYKATYESEYYYVKAIFRQRIADRTATTGAHNYAYNMSTKEIAKSGTSGHAEILLLSTSEAQKGDSVILISEYKPCKYCQEHIEKIEKARGIEVRVIWLLDYEEKGDGDINATRDFYREKNWLLGGGIYVYSVNPDDSGYK